MNQKSMEKINKLNDKIQKLDEKIKLAKNEQKECYKKIAEIEDAEKLTLIKSLTSGELENAIKMHEITEKSGMSLTEIAELLEEENKND